MRCCGRCEGRAGVDDDRPAAARRDAAGRLQDDACVAVTRSRVHRRRSAAARPRRVRRAGEARARTRLPAVIESALRLLAAIAADYQALDAAPRGGCRRRSGRLAAEVRAQRDALVYPGFLAATPWERSTMCRATCRRCERRIAAPRAESRARRTACGAGGRMVGALPRAAGAPRRAAGEVVGAARGVPLADRGTARFAVRAGAARRRCPCRSSVSKKHGPTSRGTADGLGAVAYNPPPC